MEIDQIKKSIDDLIEGKRIDRKCIDDDIEDLRQRVVYLEDLVEILIYKIRNEND